jgi:hypothetical protein
VRLKPEHWLGLIAVLGTFAAAIAGAWVGGSIANNGARDLQEDQARREDARELAAARTAARLFLAELIEVNDNVFSSARRGCWLPLDYTLDLSRDDRRLLAAKLPRWEWSAVVLAFRWEDRLSMERRDRSFTLGYESDMELAVGAMQRFHRIAPLLASFARVKPNLAGSPNDPAWVRRFENPRGTYPSLFCPT